MSQMRQWRCRNKHILGFIHWDRLDVPQLMVLREALDMNADCPDEVDLIGPMEGYQLVRCSICDDVQVWEVSVQAMVSLFLRLSLRKRVELLRRLDVIDGKSVSSKQSSVISEQEGG